MDAKQLWKLVLDDLQVTISPASFGSWIKPLMLADVDESGGQPPTAVIDCPSHFHQLIIVQRYKTPIQEAVERVMERRIELHFRVNNAAGQAKQDQDAGPLFEATQPSVDEAAFKMHRLGLRDDFTFDSFAVSSSNEMAHAAAVAVAEDFGTAYNPLFLYGGVGVGKTHLMQAVAIRALQKNQRLSIIYCAGEEFTNEIIDAIQQKTTRQFKKRYREVKGLLIDDIQFIAGKTTVQEEFFHTFNAILKTGGQVIMTSDRPPAEIPELEARLRSRFEAGLLVDIGKPDFELRTAITLIKAKQRRMSLKMEEAKLIAANIESARRIEGFLVRLHTESTLRHKIIDETLIQSLMGKTATAEESAPPPLRPMEVVRGAADFFNVTTKQIKGAGRSKPLVMPRHLAMYLLRVDYKMPFTEIGFLFSGRDHTTVMHAVDKITRELQDSSELRHNLASVRKQLYHH
jgi:chromosomal replication initiator protein